MACLHYQGFFFVNDYYFVIYWVLQRFPEFSVKTLNTLLFDLHDHTWFLKNFTLQEDLKMTSMTSYAFTIYRNFYIYTKTLLDEKACIYV